jgi:hypothetical protein
MSIGKNTRKPVAAASAMPRTIDKAKSDMKAPLSPSQWRLPDFVTQSEAIV